MDTCLSTDMFHCLLSIYAVNLTDQYEKILAKELGSGNTDLSIR